MLLLEEPFEPHGPVLVLDRIPSFLGDPGPPPRGLGLGVGPTGRLVGSPSESHGLYSGRLGPPGILDGMSDLWLRPADSPGVALHAGLVSLDLALLALDRGFEAPVTREGLNQVEGVFIESKSFFEDQSVPFRPVRVLPGVVGCHEGPKGPFVEVPFQVSRACSETSRPWCASRSVPREAQVGLGDGDAGQRNVLVGHGVLHHVRVKALGVGALGGVPLSGAPLGGGEHDAGVTAEIGLAVFLDLSRGLPIQVFRHDQPDHERGRLPPELPCWQEIFRGMRR